ncbi:MAG: isochorismatase family protein [Campylobacterales bacterium]
MRLKPHKTAAVIIDFQEKLFPHMADHETLAASAAKLAAGLKLFEVPTLITQQYTKGLGATLPTLGFEGTVYEKMDFSVFRQETFSEGLRKLHKKHLIIAGIEAHICVMQTCLDLIEAGYKLFVCEDAIGSRDPKNRQNAVERLRAAGACITNVESVLFELCGTAQHEQFKALSKLVK